MSLYIFTTWSLTYRNNNSSSCVHIEKLLHEVFVECCVDLNEFFLFAVKPNSEFVPVNGAEAIPPAVAERTMHSTGLFSKHL